VPFTGESAVEIAMKHLSQVPDPPSTIRREIPHDVDLVVLRALAKDPADRYRSAAEMDRDLELVARGDAVGKETADAATVVLSGAHDATALTQASRRPPPASGEERYRAYDTPVGRGRSIWPWLIGLGVVLALAAGGYFLYQKVQEQISESSPVTVQQYTGLLVSKAQDLVTNDGFEPQVQREPDPDVSPGIVFKQEPTPGTKLGRGSIVVLHVSTGKPKVAVPGVVGKSSTDAVAALVGAGLTANPQNVPSDQQAGTVVAQDPKAGTVIVEGSTVRINVSTGPKQVFLPSVVGLQYDQASAQLQTAGFAVRRTDVDSDRPAGEVVDQTPAGNQQVADHSAVVLKVSKGPTTSTVPDVINLDSATAQTTLEESNFKVKIVFTDTTDPTQDDHVISQDPAGGSQAKPDSKVTITVGRYVEPPPADTTTTTTAPTQ